MKAAGQEEEEKVGDEDMEARMDAFEALAEVLEGALQTPTDKGLEAALTRASLVLAGEFKEMKIQASALNQDLKTVTEEVRVWSLYWLVLTASLSLTLIGG